MAEIAGTNLFQGCGGSLNADNEESLYQELEKMEKSGLYVAEPKEDGIFATVNFKSDGTEFISRNGLEKETSLTHIVPPKSLWGYSFVGELAYGSQASVIEKEKAGLSNDEHFVRIFRLLKYESETRILDYTDMNEVSQRELMEDFWRNLDGAEKSKYQLLDRWESDFVDHYRSIVDDDGEGLVLKAKNGVYRIGTRSLDWIKVKKTLFVDMIVVGVEMSEAKSYKYRQFAKAIYVGAYVNGKIKKLSRVGSMPNEWRENFGQNFDQYKGQVVEIHAFEQFKSGALRHPSFVRLRPDKKSTECIFVS
jgi:hypothetical protein